MTLLQTECCAQLARSFPDGVAWRNFADGSELTLEGGTANRTGSPGAWSERGLERATAVGAADRRRRAARMADVVPGDPQGRRGGGAAAGPARSGRADPDPGPRGGCGRPVQRGIGEVSAAVEGRGHCGGGPSAGTTLLRDDADLDRTLPPTTWPTSCTPRGRRARRRASSCATAVSRPSTASLRMVRAGLPLLLPCSPRPAGPFSSAAHAGRPQRMVPAPLRAATWLVGGRT